MTGAAALRRVRSEMRREVTERILPYWETVAADERHGGLVGLVTADGTRHLDAPKGSVVHARALWTFATASHTVGGDAQRDMADRLAEHFVARFLDPVHGGVYWMIEAGGRPRDDRKHVYAQAFAIYALAAHASAGRPESLARAVELFRLVERHAHDAVNGGYEEAFSRDWRQLDDVRLSPEDANERKSTNTHLHLLEAYTSLLRAWPDVDPLLAVRLGELVKLFLDRIVDPEFGAAIQFFDADWRPKSPVHSFGHDIETAWLLLDAACALDDAALTVRAQVVAERIAERVLADALDPEHGGIFYERRADGTLNTDKVWWAQAEAIVGFVAAHRLTGRPEFGEAAVRTWDFARRHLIDLDGGEWLWSVSRDGSVKSDREKVGPWKCPYHTARACIEVVHRVPAIVEEAGVAR